MSIRLLRLVPGHQMLYPKDFFLPYLLAYFLVGLYLHHFHEDGQVKHKFFYVVVLKLKFLRRFQLRIKLEANVE